MKEEDTLRTELKRRFSTNILQRICAVEQKIDLQPVLLLDEVTLAIFSNLFRNHELYEEGIHMICTVDAFAMLGDFPILICVLMPSEANVKLLANYRRRRKAAAACAVHVFWATSILSCAELLEPLVKNDELLADLVDFVDLEMCFSFYSPHSINLGISTRLPELGLLDRLPNVDLKHTHNRVFDDYVQRAASFLVSLDLRPRFRYRYKSALGALNRHFCAELERYLQLNYPSVAQLSGVAHCLFVDRGVDMRALFLHDWCFEGAVFDAFEMQTTLLDSSKNGPAVNCVQLEAHGGKPRGCYLSNEVFLYRAIRYLPISEALDLLRKRLAELPNGQAGSKADLKQTIVSGRSRLSEVQDVMTNVSLFLRLANRLLEKLSAENLLAIGELEQNIVTGLDAKGRNVSALSVLEDLARYLSEDLQIADAIKVRLVLLYYYSFDGVTQENVQRMLDSAGICSRLKDAVRSLLALDVKERREGSEAVAGKHSHYSLASPQLQRDNKERCRSAISDLHRWEPELHFLGQALLSGNLPQSAFPYVDEYKPSRSQSREHNCNLFKIEDWDWHAGESNNVQDETYVIFVIGPVTFAEIRAIELLNARTNKRLYLVGSGVCTPHLLLE